MEEGLITKFENYLKTINRSDATINVYTCTLNRFADFLQDKSILDVDEDDVVEFLGNGEIKAKTKKHYLDSLNKFYKWLVRRNKISKNPVEDLYSEINVRNEEPKKHPELSKGDIQQVILKTKSPRDKTMLLFLFKTGLRAEELRQLNRQDVDFDSGKVTIRRRKGGKSGYVLIDDETIKKLKFYLALRRDDNAPLFASIDGGRLSKKSIFQIVQKCCSYAGFEGVKPHSFRHYFTTALQLNGCHPEAIRELRGDSKGVGGMVSYYTHFTEEQVKDWYLKTIPKLYV